MKLDDLKEHCLKTLKQTEKFPTKTFEEHALVLRLIENQTSVIAELEEIKAEAFKRAKRCDTQKDYDYGYHTAMTDIGNIIEERIKELNNDL